MAKLVMCSLCKPGNLRGLLRVILIVGLNGLLRTLEISSSPEFPERDRVALNISSIPGRWGARGIRHLSLLPGLLWCEMPRSTTPALAETLSQMQAFFLSSFLTDVLSQ